MKIYLLALFMGIAMYSSSQSKINQLNLSGKKQGTWVVYLDNSWNEVTDSNKASFCRFTYFDNGINIQPIGPCGRSWVFTNTGGNNLLRGRTELMDGEYTWTDSKGKNRCIATFKNGECLRFKWYYPSGTIRSCFDYTKKWKGQDHSYFITSYNSKGVATYSYWRKADGGWGAVTSSKVGDVK